MEVLRAEPRKPGSDHLLRTYLSYGRVTVIYTDVFILKILMWFRPDTVLGEKKYTARGT